ncbi:DUF2911 domain-containing protein [Bizionia gelidisalsuginis]|uniref:DUF2911 domain-containing protein n=1 Tax=Bizionia gelidisalsuginis TaxID=291188 RepID=A0ABY3MF06_9FLAO|nr:DUF2911 domain-containing protein [Bizionia gelidisalsuginis]TYC18134.1 DUF2911 domain-containing protein [Bizionia gelidisalsuginis]
MKKLLLLAVVFSASFAMKAQIEIPQPSPFSKVEQKVGLTDVTLEYSRPGMRDREVFGNLVPYGKVWRTGANINSKITFSEDVMVGGSDVKAGSYAIYTKPNVDSWEIYLYSTTQNWGLPEKWDDSKVVATVKAEAYKLPMQIETFTMGFDDLTSSSALLGIMWSDIYVGLPFTVHTDKTVSTSIDKALNGPSASDYYSAATYYLEEGKDAKKANEWMQKAISMMKDPQFYQLRKQSLIYAAVGDKKNAIKTAKMSLAKSKEAGNMDYVKMNEDSLKEWGAL